MAQLHCFQDLVSDALEVVEFKLIRQKSDLLDEDLTFRPLMAHQIFGEKESIFGYENLRVQIYYTAGPMQIYLGVEYGSKVDTITNGEVKADDIINTVAHKLPDGCYFMSMDEFLKTLDKADKFQPFGEKLAEHKYSKDGKERFFEIYQCDHKQNSFLKFFSRLQTFILWFVDAASYIDIDDPQWKYFICYEKYKNDNGDYQYATVGYTTVYEYYAYPQHKRPRISQMLVLPPFQNMGVATKFIKTIYMYYQSHKDVIDITVEDPSDEFQRLRNFVDTKLCLKLSAFGKDLVKKGFNNEMVKEAREILKINPRQTRKVYEIVRLYHTNIHDAEEYRSYRLDVKKRLNIIYYKTCSDIKKMEKAKVDTEMLRARLPNLQARMVQLQEEFEEVEKEYNHIIDKLR